MNRELPQDYNFPPVCCHVPVVGAAGALQVNNRMPSWRQPLIARSPMLPPRAAAYHHEDEKKEENLSHFRALGGKDTGWFPFVTLGRLSATRPGRTDY